MRAKKFVCCLLVMLLLVGVSFISCGNSSKAKADNELTAQDGENFKSFLDKFTSSAAFQYTRIKFPLKTPITLLADDGETEKKFPFTKGKWPLLDSYEESEVDLRVEFELQADGKWYVVDCYTGWYGYDLPIGELKQTIQNVKEENAAFEEVHP